MRGRVQWSLQSISPAIVHSRSPPADVPVHKSDACRPTAPETPPILVDSTLRPDALTSPRSPGPFSGVVTRPSPASRPAGRLIRSSHKRISPLARSMAQCYLQAPPARPHCKYKCPPLTCPPYVVPPGASPYAACYHSAPHPPIPTVVTPSNATPLTCRFFSIMRTHSTSMLWVSTSAPPSHPPTFLPPSSSHASTALLCCPYTPSCRRSRHNNHYGRAPTVSLI